MANVQTGPIDLSTYQWHYRLVLVFAPTDADTAYTEQLAILAGHKAGNADRDLLIGRFPADGTGQFNDRQIAPEAIADLRRQLTVEGDSFAVLLIGKDGGVKVRSPRPLTGEQLFTTIDQMPMRQQERSSR